MDTFEKMQFKQKLEEMHKYVPFLENLIKQLENEVDKPRPIDLSKIQTLHGLLTEKNSKLRLDTLLKCERLLLRLHSKVLKRKKESNQMSNEIIELSDPDSPDNRNEEYRPPVVIPTERKRSPEPFTPNRFQWRRTPTHDPRNSGRNFQTDRRSPHPKFKNQTPQERMNAIRTKRFATDKPRDNNRFHNHVDLTESGGNTTPIWDIDDATDKPRDNNRFQNLVDLTESGGNTTPIWDIDDDDDAEIREKLYNHPAPASNASVKLKTNKPSTITSNSFREERASTSLWNPSPPLPDNHNVFNRVRSKHNASSPISFEDSRVRNSHTKPVDVSDVLKSPPLTNHDINDLFKESGDESDRRLEPELKGDDFEAVRKKLALVAKLNKTRISETAVAPQPVPAPTERLALKYNPHHRTDKPTTLQPDSAPTDQQRLAFQYNPHHRTDKPTTATQYVSSTVPVAIPVSVSITIPKAVVSSDAATSLPSPTTIFDRTRPYPKDPRVNKTATVYDQRSNLPGSMPNFSLPTFTHLQPPTYSIYPQECIFGPKNNTSVPVINDPRRLCPKFNPKLNDNFERSKYFESKKIKEAEPQTFSEYLERKRLEKENGTASKCPTNSIDSKNTSATVKDTALDKMYRSSDYNKEMRMNSSFKIPKKAKDSLKASAEELVTKPKSITEIKSSETKKIDDRVKSDALKETVVKKTKWSKDEKKAEAITKGTKDEKKPEAIIVKNDSFKDSKSKDEKCKSASAKSDANQVKDVGEISLNSENQKTQSELKNEKVKSVSDKSEVKDVGETSLNSKNQERQSDLKDENCKSARAKSVANQVKDVGEIVLNSKNQDEKCNAASAKSDVSQLENVNELGLNSVGKKRQEESQSDLFTKPAADFFPAPLPRAVRIVRRRQTNFIEQRPKPIENEDKSDKISSFARIRNRRKSLSELSNTKDTNCELSMQNIITGKRSTRVNISLNESQLEATQLRRKKEVKNVPPVAISDTSTATGSASPQTASKTTKGRKSSAAVVPTTSTRSSRSSSAEAQNSVISSTTPVNDEVKMNSSNVASANKDDVDVKKCPKDDMKLLSLVEKVDETKQISEDDVKDSSLVDVVESDKHKEPTKTRAKKNELQRLNEDIRDMFICKGVLRATGRRMCTKKPEESLISKITESMKTTDKRVRATGKLAAKLDELKKSIKTRRTKVVVARCSMPFMQRCVRKSPKFNKLLESPTSETSLTMPVLSPYRSRGRPKKLVRTGTKPAPQSKRVKYNVANTARDHSEEKRLSVEKTDSVKTAVEESPITMPGVKTDALKEAVVKKTKGTKGEKKPEANDSFQDGKAEKVKSASDKSEVEDVVPQLDVMGEKRIVQKSKNDQLKNVNPEMHAKSEYATKCVLCPNKHVNRSTAAHYVSAHNNSEVYISRMPPHNLVDLKANQKNFALYSTKFGSNKKMKAYFYRCPFCDIPNTMICTSWIGHFATHTGEYRYKCSKCFKIENGKKPDMEKHIKRACPGATIIYRPKIPCKNSIRGYICRFCNFTQMIRDNVVSHLKNHHDLETVGEDDIIPVILLNVENVDDESVYERAVEPGAGLQGCDEVVSEVGDRGDSNGGMEDPNGERGDPIRSESLEILNTDKLNQKIQLPEEKEDEQVSMVRKSTEIAEEITSLLSVKTSYSSVKVDNNMDNSLSNFPATVPSKTSETSISATEPLSDGAETPSLDGTTSSMKIDDKPSTVEPKPNSIDKKTSRQSVDSEVHPIVSAQSPIHIMPIESTSAAAPMSPPVPVTNIFNSVHDAHTPQASNAPEQISLLKFAMDESAPTSPIPTKLTMAERLSQRFKNLSNSTSETVVGQRDIPLSKSTRAPTPTASTSQGLFNGTVMTVIPNPSKVTKNCPEPIPVPEKKPSAKSWSTSIVDRLNERLKSTNNQKANNQAEFLTTPSPSKQANLSLVSRLSARLQSPTETVALPKSPDEANCSSQSLNHESTRSEVLSEDLDSSDNLIIDESFEEEDGGDVANQDKANEASKPPVCIEQGDDNNDSDWVDDDDNWEDIEVITETVVPSTSQPAKNKTKPKANNYSLLSKLFASMKSNTSKKEKKSKDKSRKTSESASGTTSSCENTSSNFDCPPLTDLFPSCPIDELSTAGALQDFDALLDTNFDSLDSNLPLLDLTNMDSSSNPISEHAQVGISSSQTSTSGTVRIDKLGYSIKDAMVKYYCLVDGCTFLYSELPIGLQNHFIMEHPNVGWNGYCCKCEAQVCTDQILPLSKEMKHMIEFHTQVDESASKEGQGEFAEKSAAAEKPRIKLRRLTGDVLSKADAPSIAPIVCSERSISVNEELSNSLTDEYLLSNNFHEIPENGILEVISTENLTTPVIEGNLNTDCVTKKSLESGLKISSVSSLTEEQWRNLSDANPPPIVVQPPVEPPLQIMSVSEMQRIAPKSTDVLNLQLRDICLYSRYKCMDIACSFTAQSRVKMWDHLHSHLKVSQPLETCWLNCPYCKYSAVTILDYMNHIDEFHKYDLFQCPYCFYRTCVDFNVIKHIESCHSTREKAVLVCLGETKTYDATAREIRKSREKNVLAMPCNDCPKRFYIPQHYAKHVAMHYTCYNTSDYVCALCPDSKVVPKKSTDEHLRTVHNINVLECIYCEYSTKDMEAMTVHLCTEHASNFPYFCVRVPPKKNNITGNETLESSTVLASATEPVDRKLIKKCQFSEDEMNCISSPIEHTSSAASKTVVRQESSTSIQTKPVQSVQSCAMEKPQIEQQTKLLEKEKPVVVGEGSSNKVLTSPVENILPDSAKSIKKAVPAQKATKVNTTEKPEIAFIPIDKTTERPEIAFVPIAKTTERPELEFVPIAKTTVKPKIVSPLPSKNEIKLPIAKTTEKPEIVFVPIAKTTERPEIASVPKAKTTEKPEIASPLPSKNEIKPTTPAVPDLTMDQKIYKAAQSLVEDTGVSDEKLYMCISPDCEKLSDEHTFLSHLYNCIHRISAKHKQEFICKWCKNTYKQGGHLKQHLKSHTQHRFLCYSCNHTTASAQLMTKHCNEAHSNKGPIQTSKLLPNKINSFLVAYPKDAKSIDVRQYGEKLVRLWERKNAENKKSFAPDECDQLPLRPIFSVDVFCSICNYKTKVRTNMVRHLQMHKQEVSVSSVDPVNPVPCLNSGEKHFDKMVNLSCSSYTQMSKEPSSTKDPKQNFKIPGYVPTKKRFVCGVPGCTYLTINDYMLRCHLSALHSSEKSYTCPLCKEDICKEDTCKKLCVERVIQHLRYHDVRLYQCDNCNYLHYQKHVVDRHIADKHATQKVNLVTHERTETNSKQTTVTVIGKNFSEDSVPDAQDAIESSTSNSGSEKLKWECSICHTKTQNEKQMIAHTRSQHNSKHMYQCVHCSFGGPQLSNITDHITEAHPTKVREVQCFYKKINESDQDKAADTRPLWSRHDPQRVRNIRGILMESEDEAEINAKKHLSCPQDDPEEDEEESSNLVDKVQFNCFHCSAKGETFDDIRTHWEHTHWTEYNGKKAPKIPFWFRISRQLFCVRCTNFKGDLVELTGHTNEEHKGQKVAAADCHLQATCGFCNFTYDNAEILANHVEQKHETFEIKNLNLNGLKSILALGDCQPVLQCYFCAQLFANTHNIVEHEREVHLEKSLQCFRYKQIKDESIYLCPSCEYSSTNEIATLRHMVDHYDGFETCKFCDKKFETFTTYLQHTQSTHPNQSKKFAENFPQDKLFAFFMNMLVLFPNGFVIEKCCLTDTLYGSKDKLHLIYNDLLKRSQEKQLYFALPDIPKKPANKNSAAEASTAPKPKQVRKRRNTIVSEVSDIQATNSSEKGPAIKKRRNTVFMEESPISKNIPEFSLISSKPGKIIMRRNTVNVEKVDAHSHSFNKPAVKAAKVKRGRKSICLQNIDNYSDGEDWTPSGVKRPRTSAKASSSQDVEYYSFYGTKPEPQDLSKVYTHLPIGGANVKVSCDKFALLVDINAKVRVEKANVDEYLAPASNVRACPKSEKYKYSN